MQHWQQMSQAELDAAYANADYIPDAGSFPVRWAAEAAIFRATANAMFDIPYDAAERARLDLFHPVNPARGLVVFVHGGYWRRFGKSDWSHFAKGALAADHAVAIVGYPLAPLVRIADITRHVAQAVDCAAAHVDGPIRLTGHSAGGHLVARMLMPDASPVCAGRIATCVPISPVADLRPLVPQSLNADWRLDEAEALSESPVLGHKRSQARVAIHVGGDERPSFLWQARALSDAWRAPLRVDRRKHHFDVIDDLLDPASDLMADILA
ncbi:alpha/beta hydrolase [Jannaschia sp. 2305UL9-9]|uniref:alpha/beta hydrolase n=1 Tax=Jannaschia sp. 2305UL9-9 TaxID=3121638 RepID=UPI003529362D